jgi:twitching motility protein PilJ
VVSLARSTTDVVGGALLAVNAGAALDEIEQVSHQIASLVQNISSSGREQTRATTAITESMRVLREISAKTTDSTNAASAAISKLSELASQLRHTVSGFTLPEDATGTSVLSQARIASALEARPVIVESAPTAAVPSQPPVARPARTEHRRRSG